MAQMRPWRPRRNACHDCSCSVGCHRVQGAMKATVWRRHRLLNGLQSLLLLGAMAAILSGLGWVVAGESGIFWALAGGVALVLFSPGFSPRLVLRMYAARALGPTEAPELHGLLATLAERAGLPTTPELYYVPSQMLNAFAVGTRSHSAVAVTDALLRALSPRELAGVLAHEMSHVRHSDMWVMGLADLFSRMNEPVLLVRADTAVVELAAVDVLRVPGELDGDPHPGLRTDVERAHAARALAHPGVQRGSRGGGADR